MNKNSFVRLPRTPLNCHPSQLQNLVNCVASSSSLAKGGTNSCKHVSSIIQLCRRSSRSPPSKWTPCTPCRAAPYARKLGWHPSSKFYTAETPAINIIALSRIRCQPGFTSSTSILVALIAAGSITCFIAAVRLSKGGCQSHRHKLDYSRDYLRPGG